VDLKTLQHYLKDTKKKPAHRLIDVPVSLIVRASA
jgi:hypothetical protein